MAKRKRSGKPPGAPNAGNTKRARVDGEVEAPAVKIPTETDILLSDRSLFADDLSRADHDRERRLYQLLGSCDPEDRIRAGDVIIMALLGKQGEEEVEETEKEADKDTKEESTESTESTAATEAKDERERVSESVLLRHLERRLLRGLATSNEASRVGFSYVLSEMLGRLFGRRDIPAEEAAETASLYAAVYPKITFDRVLDLLIEKTTTGSSVPGQEQRDHHWGRLFGLMSFVESGILFGPGDEGRVRRWDSVLEHLLQLSHRVVWLRAYTFYVIAQAILRGQLPDQETVASTLRAVAADTTSGASLAKTPEGLGIWLAALTRFPDMALPAPWTQPLAPASHKDVVAVLRSGGAGDDEESKALKQGNATPQLHFVWDLILSELLSASSKRFDGFWIAVVDQVYFAKGATDHQKLTGFKVFQKALALCAAAGGAIADGIPPSLFSNNLMACLINQASNPTPRLHRTAVSVLRDIEFQVEENPSALVSVLTGLLGAVPQAHGVYDFDERVKGTGDGTKPVEHILRFANSDNVEDVIALLRSGALQAKDPKNDQRPIRIYAEYLFRLVSRPIGADNDNDDDEDEDASVSVSGTAFKALAELAYRSDEAPAKDSKKDKKNKKKATAVAFPTLTDKTQTSARQYLLSAAGAILKRPDDLAPFCRTVYGIDPEAVGVAMTGEIKENVVDARKQLKKLVVAFDAEPSKAKGNADVSSRAKQGLAVLLSVSLLQLYHEPRADAIEVLHDIKACGDKLASGGSSSAVEKKNAKKTKKDDSDSDSDIDDEAEPDIGQVLTDVLLSLLAESSQLTRQTSLLVFEAFAPFMSAEALDNLADVLSAEENTSGYRSLFNPDEGEEEDDEDDSDLEMMDMDDEEGDDDDEDDDEEDEEEDEEEDDEEDSEEDDEEEEKEETPKKEAKAKDDKKAAAKKAPVALKDDDGFEAALMKTFNSSVGAPKKGDNDAEDDDDDSDNESDMDDDAMLALDNALAGHLALIRDKTDSHKKEREEAKTRVVQFKHRVLDLLEVYIRAGAGQGEGNGNSVLLFRLFLPLAVLVRETKDKSLAQKATRVVQKLKLQLKRRRSQTRAPAESSTPASIDASLAVLSSLHEAANDRTENKAFAAAVSAASLAISSTLLWMAVTESDADDDKKKKESRHKVFLRVAAIYDATKAHCEKDDWNVRKELFTDYNNWCQTTVNAGAD